MDEVLQRIENAILIGSKNILNIRDASLITGLSERAIKRLCNEGAITYSRPQNGAYFFRREDLEKWMMSERHTSMMSLDQDAANKMYRMLKSNR